MDFKFCVETISYDEFYSFLKDVEHDFLPPLLSRIDAEAFYKKLSTYATLIECYSGNQLVGLSASYDNNLETKLAFVTFIAVKKEFRGNNIAGILLQRIAEHAKDSGMTVVGIDTNNIIAKQCYQKNGFELKESHFVEEYNITRYYLEKNLC